MGEVKLDMARVPLVERRRAHDRDMDRDSQSHSHKNEAPTRLQAIATTPPLSPAKADPSRPATELASCPQHLKELGLIAFLDASCRPAFILRRNYATISTGPTDDIFCEYENAAFSKVYTVLKEKTAFVTRAAETIHQFDAGVTSITTRIEGHHCTCTLLSASSILVSWNAVPVQSKPPVCGAETQISMSSSDIHRNANSLLHELSVPHPEPWEAGARELGWTRYKNMQLTTHQKRIASHPWRETSLGDISTWSTAHKLAVSASAMNPNPRCLYWGADLVALYNEHCIPIFGNKHPFYLGRTPGEVWPEVWAFAKPYALKALHEGKPSRLENQQLFVNRTGLLEETFFDSVWLPLPGVDSEDNGVLNQFTEVTDSSIAKRQQSLVSHINDRAQHVDSMHEYWTTVMSSMQDNPYDVAYALLFTPEDFGSPCPSRTSSPSLGEFANTWYILWDQIGLKDCPFDTNFRFTLTGQVQKMDAIIDAIRHAYMTDSVVLLEHINGTLPEYLNVAAYDRGWGDTVRSAAVLPIANVHQGAPSAFLVLGLNPRRPVDDRTRAFTQVMRDCLVKGASLANLPSHVRRHQKQMDELHQSLLSRLHASNLESRRLSARFQRMSDAAPIGIFIGTPDGTKKLYVNDEYLNLTAMTREDIKSPLAWLERIADEDVDRVKAAMSRTLVDLKPTTIEYRTKTNFQVIDEVTGLPISVPRHLMVTCMPEFDEHGNVTCLQGWVHNVSQERFTQRLLSSRLEEVTASKQNAENFIDMVSHEMRNPLSAILQSADGIISLLETSDHTDKRRLSMTAETVESVMDASQTIILCAQHQKRIVDDILTLSKLDANLLVISPDKTKPARLLSKALKMFDAQLVRGSIKSSVSISPTVAELNVEEAMMDSSRVLQIVINLLTNAIKFTSYAKKRAISLELSASMTCPGDAGEDTDVEYVPRRESRPRSSVADLVTGDEVYLTFMVRDTGKGLNTEEKTSLFHRFSQASPKTYKKYGGSGLGLFISRELTELQGGQIGVSSEAGKGSTFAFYILVRRWIPITPLDGLARVESIHTPIMLESPVAYSRRECAAMFDSTARSTSRLGATITPPPGSPDRVHLGRQKSSSSPSLADIAPDPTQQMSVLIVEDNVINQKVMAKQICAAGHVVHIANHGLEALSFLRRTTFCAHLSPSQPTPDYLNQGTPPVSLCSPGPVELDVILMDLEMPILDGLSCVSQIRAMEAIGDIKGHVPVIAVTANARSEQITTALAAGMDQVVTKPFRIWQVLDRASGLVAMQRSREKPQAGGIGSPNLEGTREVAEGGEVKGDGKRTDSFQP